MCWLPVHRVRGTATSTTTHGRDDPKNSLYLKVARAAEIFRPAVAIVENVPAVQHDRNNVVASTVAAFEKLECTRSTLECSTCPR